MCAVNPLPSEEVRKALGDRIQLTAQQVQVTNEILSPMRVDCNDYAT